MTIRWVCNECGHEMPEDGDEPRTCDQCGSPDIDDAQDLADEEGLFGEIPEVG
jgi:predicted Zn-ribbon and HTH transcriptional regulator